jgi:hypothetical protein
LSVKDVYQNLLSNLALRRIPSINPISSATTAFFRNYIHFKTFGANIKNLIESLIISQIFTNKNWTRTTVCGFYKTVWLCYTTWLHQNNCKNKAKKLVNLLIFLSPIIYSKSCLLQELWMIRSLFVWHFEIYRPFLLMFLLISAIWFKCFCRVTPHFLRTVTILFIIVAIFPASSFFKNLQIKKADLIYPLLRCRKLIINTNK